MSPRQAQLPFKGLLLIISVVVVLLTVTLILMTEPSASALAWALVAVIVAAVGSVGLNVSAMSIRRLVDQRIELRRHEEARLQVESERVRPERLTQLEEAARRRARPSTERRLRLRLLMWVRLMWLRLRLQLMRLRREPEATVPRPQPTYVPLMSAPIAAGTGTLPDDMVEELVPLPRDLVGQGELFMLQVRGDSMVEAGVLDGDYVVVRRQYTADNGDMVAVLLPNMESEATVKYFSRRGGHVLLLPANPAFEPLDGDLAQILGRVVSVLRRL
jgi:SOS regulatory protein LexA